ncbi:MAG: shikimate dehydrogenase [Megasphaera sp.]|jgi:shikimate dehydrogenase|nr:shikimate dehydrogenase [Megasphaera sp.]
MGKIPITERVTGHTELIGLIAYPIRHSMSPTMHNEAFKKLGLDYIYVCFEVGTDTLEDTVKGLRAMNVRGFNVSMPNKVLITQYVDVLSPVSQIVGACNTVINDGGILTGTSTDGMGAMMALKAHGVDYIGKKMTVIGAGGAATSIQVQAALDGVGELVIFNVRDAFYEQAERIVKTLEERTDCTVHLYDLADHDRLFHELATSQIYIDATPCGMHPLEDVVAIPAPSYLPEGLVVMDTVYAPRQTKLMKWAQQRGCQNFNGLDMMLYQGAAAFKLWTGKDMPIDYIRDILFE